WKVRAFNGGGSSDFSLRLVTRLLPLRRCRSGASLPTPPLPHRLLLPRHCWRRQQDDAPKVLDVTLEPARQNLVLVGYAELDAVMKDHEIRLLRASVSLCSGTFLLLFLASDNCFTMHNFALQFHGFLPTSCAGES
ncbi:unnamed protein product, partial [Urochloa humidicola]